jgi:hypothetical protein
MGSRGAEAQGSMAEEDGSGRRYGINRIIGGE